METKKAKVEVKCAVQGCLRKKRSFGFCPKHYLKRGMIGVDAGLADFARLKTKYEVKRKPYTNELEVKATAPASSMRRFVLDRALDSTGTSGIGIVAEGIQFSNGQVVIHWLSQLEAVNVYGNAMVLEKLHGHGGNTSIVWLD